MLDSLTMLQWGSITDSGRNGQEPDQVVRLQIIDPQWLRKQVVVVQRRKAKAMSVLFASGCLNQDKHWVVTRDHISLVIMSTGLW
uniref:Uncharacterized protein n=1 Tax=Brassica oleracea TaxID=3712 RepID=A0A3P6BE98_BRAOL|nr:unnamed protein product [Brassica oleracea]